MPFEMDPLRAAKQITAPAAFRAGSSPFAQTAPFRAGNPDSPGLGSPVSVVAPAQAPQGGAMQPALAPVQAAMMPTSSFLPFGAASAFQQNLPSSNVPQQVVQEQRQPTPWMPNTTGNFRDQTFKPYAEIPDYIKQDALNAWNRGFTQDATDTSGMQTLQEYDQWFSDLFNRTKNAQFIGNKVRADYYEKYMPQKVAEQYRAERLGREHAESIAAAQDMLNRTGNGDRYQIGPDGKPIERPDWKGKQAAKELDQQGLLAKPEDKKREGFYSGDKYTPPPPPKPFIVIGDSIKDNPDYVEWKDEQKRNAQFEGMGNNAFQSEPYGRKALIVRQYEAADKIARSTPLTDEELNDPVKAAKAGLVGDELKKIKNARAYQASIDRRYGINPEASIPDMSKAGPLGPAEVTQSATPKPAAPASLPLTEEKAMEFKLRAAKMGPKSQEELRALTEKMLREAGYRIE